MSQILNSLTLMIKGGATPEAARGMLLQLVPDTAAVDAAFEEFRQTALRIRKMKDPGSVNADSFEPWYTGPTDHDTYWPAYKKYLKQKGWDEKGLNILDQSSTKIISLLPHPGTGSFSTRGLVVGYVQSGKTANYTAVISKAADVGYKFFIVLAGTTNALRNQTQGRLDREISDLNDSHWIGLTGPSEDFNASRNVNAFLSQRGAHNVLCVMKKNGPRLRRLKKWLSEAQVDVLKSCPILIIDDEADQAGVNAAKPENDRTAINKLMIEILAILPKAAYVGYTATPFANLLIDPSDAMDLYPRDFIVDLPRPQAYFGPERIFGREQLDWDEPDQLADGLDMIRIVPDNEVPAMHPASADARFDFIPEITASLAEAIDYFVLALAARLRRGHDAQHSTMLIHTSQYAAVHLAFREPVAGYFSALTVKWNSDDSGLRTRLRELWSREQDAVPSSIVGEIYTPFEELESHISEALDRIEIKVENGISADRIDYTVPGQTLVVIGGNVLGRGLTLEGLIVSYFLRTASAYDTLLQMGRWFGYRFGYADLPRMWMTSELKNYFYDMAAVEAEIRHDIERYQLQHITPLDFGVRIRVHPKLAITAKLKMQAAVKSSMSYSGEQIQTLIFRHKDATWLQHNTNAVRTLLSSARSVVKEESFGARPNVVLRAVPNPLVRDFLKNYRFHEGQQEIKVDLLLAYVDDQIKKGQLENWNVVVITRRSADLGVVDIGLSQPVSLINRSRFMRGNAEFADIKALMSEKDVAADLDLTAEDLKARRSVLLERRQSAEPRRGLLLIYPISKDSIAVGNPPHNDRKALEAVLDVMGVGIVFPKSEAASQFDYMTVDLSGVPRDEPDPDVEDEEAE